MSGQTIAEIIDELYSDFSARQISEFLEQIGLLEKNANCFVEPFEKFVFLRGSQDEVYTLKERMFIENVGSVFSYPDFYKETSRGYIPCRFVAADLSMNLDDIYSAVFFMKIVIKAMGGFTIFIIKLSDGIHLGIRIFDKDEWRNCTLSEPETLAAVLEEVVWADVNAEFLRYYNTLVEAIKPVSDKCIDFDEMIIKKRGVQSGYIELLYEVQNMYGESVQSELGRYQDSFESDYMIDYAEILEECMEELKNVQSSKVNTIEMLFEADEIERIMKDVEEQQNKYLEGSSEDDGKENNFSIIEEMDRDPEIIIKKLKNLKGLT